MMTDSNESKKIYETKMENPDLDDRTDFMRIFNIDPAKKESTSYRKIKYKVSIPSEKGKSSGTSMNFLQDHKNSENASGIYSINNLKEENPSLYRAFLLCFIGSLFIFPIFLGRVKPSWDYNSFGMFLSVIGIIMVCIGFILSLISLFILDDYKFLYPILLSAIILGIAFTCSGYIYIEALPFRFNIDFSGTKNFRLDKPFGTWRDE